MKENVVVGRLIPCGTSLSVKRNEAKLNKTRIIEQELAEEMTALPDVSTEHTQEEDAPSESV